MGNVEEKILTDTELETYFEETAIGYIIREIKKYPTLSDSEFLKLFNEYKKGSKEAENLLINSNLRLVLSIAKRYIGDKKSLQIEDLFQEGTFGIMRALETYNPADGKFTTYAYYWIKQKISRATINTDDEIRRSEPFIFQKNKYNKLIKEYQLKGIPIPSKEEIMSILKISSQVYDLILEDVKKNTVSLNTLISDGESTELGDFVPFVETSYKSVEETMDLERLLIVFKFILNPSDYYFLYQKINNSSFQSIANTFGTKRQNLDLINNRIKKIIKQYLDYDNGLFREAINKISQIYYLDEINIEPIDPLNIIKYLFVQNELDAEERKILGFYFFKPAANNFKAIFRYLGMKEADFKNKLHQLLTFVKTKTEKNNAFNNFKNQLISEYGFLIYNLIYELNDGLYQLKDFDIIKLDYEIIDYKDLFDRYSNIPYETFLQMFNDYLGEISKAEQELLQKFFAPIEKTNYTPAILEKKLYLFWYGYDRTKAETISKKKLLKVLYSNKDFFTEEQILFLECYFFEIKDTELFEKKYPNSYTPLIDSFLVEKLELIYYGVYRLSELNFNKEMWLTVKKKYPNEFDDRRTEMLDLYFGIYEERKTISEIAKHFSGEYTKTHSEVTKAKKFVSALYYKGRRQIDIDPKKYIPYVKSTKYDFTEETRKILRMFLIEEKDYDEISSLTGLTKYRISNIITENIKKIDLYRFGILESDYLSKKQLDDYFNSRKYDKVKKRIIYDRKLNRMTPDQLSEKYGLPNSRINKIISTFNKSYMEYQISYIEHQIKDFLTSEDILREIDAHVSDSVLTEEDKEILSTYFGLKNIYNPDGLKKSADEFKKENSSFSRTLNNILLKIKARKMGLIKPCIINRKDLETYLKDLHLPISKKEYDILSYLFELNGYPYKTIAELGTLYNENAISIRRRYYRAIVNIKKYLAKEIKEKIDFDHDIKPILKYFSKGDTAIIIDYYQNELNYPELASKYSLTFDQIVAIINRLQGSIQEILNNPKQRRFDFEFYRHNLKNPELPFYGNFNLGRRIFELYVGESQVEHVSIPQIIKQLNLNLEDYVVGSARNLFMLAFCKLKDGIKKNKMFSYEEILAYYERHKNEMDNTQKNIFDVYFREQKEKRFLNRRFTGVNALITYSILKEMYPDFFNIKSANRETVLNLLRQRRKRIPLNIKKALMYYYKIQERELMSGKEINHVLKILHTLEKKKEEQLTKRKV